MEVAVAVAVVTAVLGDGVVRPVSCGAEGVAGGTTTAEPAVSFTGDFTVDFADDFADDGDGTTATGTGEDMDDFWPFAAAGDFDFDTDDDDDEDNIAAGDLTGAPPDSAAAAAIAVTSNTHTCAVS